MSSFIITGKSKTNRLQEALKLAEPHSKGVDLQVVDDIKGIGQIKELTKGLSTKPYQSKKVSLIITEAHQLTPEAQNSFLKTLEETPGQNDIYLLVDNPESLIPTVRSRCQLIDLGPSDDVIEEEDLLKAWQLYHKGSLSELFEASAQAKPEVWGELMRQLLLFQLGGKDLVSSSSKAQLTKIAPIGELEQIRDGLNLTSLQKFLAFSLQISFDLSKNINHRLAIENLFLTLPWPKNKIIKKV